LTFAHLCDTLHYRKLKKDMTEKIQKFIQDNGLVRVQASPMAEAFDLWECAGGHIWSWEMIVEAVERS
jgi:hypothetical protein